MDTARFEPASPYLCSDKESYQCSSYPGRRPRGRLDHMPSELIGSALLNTIINAGVVGVVRWMNVNLNVCSKARFEPASSLPPEKAGYLTNGDSQKKSFLFWALPLTEGPKTGRPSSGSPLRPHALVLDENDCNKKKINTDIVRSVNSKKKVSAHGHGKILNQISLSLYSGASDYGAAAHLASPPRQHALGFVEKHRTRLMLEYVPIFRPTESKKNLHLNVRNSKLHELQSPFANRESRSKATV
ncbi:uncharacterized protein M421DRAFT_93985 [Didymella exigua CBS 183.55]|uniref:Uncharacterized protein n=1 Tax=Didymella exigua CBS 183.55 TaxID=1150837 RepID=A0A6A5RG15_9PLEO|nr:uncharacterized protein M421DRAFT_93985 [Didymella exigua CBS 183.55]KAF1926439.1 hypothetical protein M421DRAFT_93985 [Didymella exigua CBS 183.55]